MAANMLALSTEDFITETADWCRAYIEAHHELPPLLLLDTPAGLYAADLSRTWGDQSARRAAVSVAGTLLGFGLDARRMFACADTWIRALPKEFAGDDSMEAAQAYAATLPNVQDDPTTREALAIMAYEKGNPSPFVFSQTYERHVALDGTAFQWDEPVRATEDKHHDNTFDAFFAAITATEEGAPDLAERQHVTLTEALETGRHTALAMADMLGLRYTHLNNDNLGRRP